jgi:hypothetical protein
MRASPPPSALLGPVAGAALAAAAIACGGSTNHAMGDAATPDRPDESHTESGGHEHREGSAADGGPEHDAAHPKEASPYDGPFVTAPHSLPTIPANGGPVFSHPLLVTVTYANDPERSFVEGLGAYLPTSPWLSAVGAEYGVGLGSSANVELPGDAPATISDSEIQALVESLVSAGTAPDPEAGVLARQLFPSSDGGPVDAGPDVSDGGGDGASSVEIPRAIYMMYFPRTTEVTLEGSSLCEVSGGGYHFQTALASHGQAFSYAVITRCSTRAELVQSASHEFIEAATDPSAGDPAFSITDPLDPWSYFGGEVGDLCSLLQPQWTEGGYSGIQRVYSNASAAAGGDPCLPSSSPYYGTSLNPSEGLAIFAGSKATVAITGWSTGPVEDWTVSAVNYIASPLGFAPVFEVPTTTMNNGGTATLTVSVPAGSQSGSFALGLLYSLKSPTEYTSSLVEVYVP